MKIIVAASIIFTLSMLSLTCKADDLIAIGHSKNDFVDFLSRPTVKKRSGEHNIQFQNHRYELLRGESIDNGCRYTGIAKGEDWGTPLIAIEIAHDAAVCERLFIVGVPKKDKIPDWVRPYKQQNMTIQGGAEAQVINNVTGCLLVQTRWTDGNQPVMKYLRDVTGYEGIQVAEASASAGYRAYEASPIQGCTIGLSSYGATLAGNADASAGGLPGFAWTLTEKNIKCINPSVCIESCSDYSTDIRVSNGVKATAVNNAYLPGIFDCRAGASINFNNISARSLNAYGTLVERWDIGLQADTVGPFEGCTENLYQITSVDDQCTPPSQ